MDLYDSGADLEKIKNEYPLDPTYYDDFNKEIYVTVCGLAFWEIGALTEQALEQIQLIVDKGAGVKVWTEECGEFVGKARQKELDKLLRKISKPNMNIRSRKKYTTVTRFHYSAGDVLTFKGSNGKFCCTYLLFITQYRGRCVYHFIPFMYSSNQKPELAQILTSYLAGEILGSTLNPLTGLEEPDFGLRSIGVLHKELLEYKPHFEKIGRFDLLPQYRKLGSEGGSRSWDDFLYSHEWIEVDMKTFGLKAYKVEDMILKE